MSEYKDEYLTKLKQLKLAQAGVDVDEAEKYVKYITEEDEAEIEQQAQEVAKDLTKKPSYVDAPIGGKATPTWRPF